jgi:predicted porin
LTADIAATEKMKITANAMYSDVQAKMKDYNPPGFTTTDAVVNTLYSINNLADYPEYSALHYRQGEVNLGLTYQFTPALYTTAQAGVKVMGDIWSSDSNTHPYGDQSGAVYSGALGLGYKF